MNPDSRQTDAATAAAVAAANAPPVQSPGARLRAARLAQHRSLQEVARVLTLSVAGVEALERDQYHLLPNNVQVGRYLAGYAQLVRLPESGINRAAEALLASRAGKFQAQNGSGRGRYRFAGARFLVLMLPLLALVLLVSWWYRHENRWHENFMHNLHGAASTVIKVAPEVGDEV